MGKSNLGIVLICLVISGCSSFGWMKNYPQDNIVEEIIEEIIESKTGLDIDLTPRSPEK